jgi:hypothetical protein
VAGGLLGWRGHCQWRDDIQAMSKVVRWTPEQLAAFEARKVEQRAAQAKPLTPMQRFQALGRLPKDQMNGTERAYADLLAIEKAAGRILDWKFHPMNVRLAGNTFYEVDFLVLDADCKISIREIKGTYTTDKGQMKIKLCAEAMPWFQFLKITKTPKKMGGGWKVEEF